MKTRVAKQKKKLNPDVLRELKALRRAGQSAKRLAELTGTALIVVRKGRIVDANKHRRQTAKQKELIRLLRPFRA
jgi:NAD+--asparagine ADP-ribosyltransferase